ncbi:MAG: glutamine synthetase [Elusimicrobia bacterium]|nr:glutamine synthetase [Elusimicrobiota bacterium]
MAENGVLSLKSLLEKIRRKEVDTVLAVFPDMLGRWMGKRVAGNFFAEEVVRSGLHACAYLLTVDMEMEPVQGFEFTSWEKGYGDFHMVPDMNTLRLLSWLEKTALVICDLKDEKGDIVEVAPRQILMRQLERAKKMGYRFKVASELELYLFKDSFDSARQKGYHHLDPLGSYIEDYHILQGTKEEFVVREIRNHMNSSGVPVEFSKGEWGFGQQEINLRYADPLEMADRHTLYKHGAKEIALQKGVAVTYMAKYSAQSAGSSFHLHSSLWDLQEKNNLFWKGGASGEPAPLFFQALAGQMALAKDFSIFFAPTVNSYKRYQASTFAPTRIAWGRDNRTCGFRIVGKGPSFRVENRIPGADANPYLAFAATIAAVLHGISKKQKATEEFRGNAYEAKGLSQVPKSLHEAADGWEKSEAARETFGEKVHAHYLHAARVEQEAFDRAVTCWELARYFERI